MDSKLCSELFAYLVYITGELCYQLMLFIRMHVVIPWTWLYNAHCFIQKWTHCCCFCIGYVTRTWKGHLTKIIKHAAYYGLYPLVVCSGDKEPVASPRGGLGGHVHPTFAPEIDMNPTFFYRGGVGGQGSPPNPRYRLALHALHVCPPHIFWPGDAPAKNQSLRLRDQDLRLRFNTLVSAKIVTQYLG